MHETSIAMRWADLDQLNHVNNVVYVDYAAQAHDSLTGQGLVPADRVTRVQVVFRRALRLSRRPVSVRSSVEGPVVSHEIAPAGVDDSFCTVRFHLDPQTVSPRREGGYDGDIAVRPTDAGPDGIVSPARYVELLQESRIGIISQMFEEWPVVVVGSIDAVLGEPIPTSTGAVATTAAVTRVGRASYDIGQWFDDGRHGTASTTLVGFDLDAQTSRPLTESERETLLRVLTPA